MLVKRDGSVATIQEMDALFRQIAKIMEEVGKNVGGGKVQKKNDKPYYWPKNRSQEEIEKYVKQIRNIKLEFAPHQLRLLSSNFMLWYHQVKSHQLYSDLYSFVTKHHNEVAKKNKDKNKNKNKNISKDEKKEKKTDRETKLQDEAKESQDLLSSSYKKFMVDFKNYMLQTVVKDMFLVWKLLEHLDVEVLIKEFDEDDYDNIESLERNIETLRLNTAMHMNDKKNSYLKLKTCLEKIIKTEKNINFLDHEELKLCLAVSPLICKYNLYNLLVSKLLKNDKKKETLENINKMMESLQLPNGLDYFQIYKYINQSDDTASSCNACEDDGIVDETDDNSDVIMGLTDDRFKNYMNCQWDWYRIDNIFTKVVDVKIESSNKLFKDDKENKESKENKDENKEDDTDDRWQGLKEKYLNNEESGKSDVTLKEHMMIRRMGSCVQMLSLFGGSDSVFGPVPLNLNGLWIEYDFDQTKNKHNKAALDSMDMKERLKLKKMKDKIFVKGQNVIPQKGLVDVMTSEQAYLWCTEEWTLTRMNQNDTLWQGTIKSTQKLQGADRKSLNIPYAPNSITMTATCDLTMELAND